jgi:hypothetical protein
MASKKGAAKGVYEQIELAFAHRGTEPAGSR